VSIDVQVVAMLNEDKEFFMVNGTGENGRSLNDGEKDLFPKQARVRKTVVAK
jgi:hypothetical protein